MIREIFFTSRIISKHLNLNLTWLKLIKLYINDVASTVTYRIWKSHSQITYKLVKQLSIPINALIAPDNNNELVINSLVVIVINVIVILAAVTNTANY